MVRHFDGKVNIGGSGTDFPLKPDNAPRRGEPGALSRELLQGESD